MAVGASILMIPIRCMTVLMIITILTLIVQGKINFATEIYYHSVITVAIGIMLIMKMVIGFQFQGHCA